MLTTIARALTFIVFSTGLGQTEQPTETSWPTDAGRASYEGWSTSVPRASDEGWHPCCKGWGGRCTYYSACDTEGRCYTFSPNKLDKVISNPRDWLAICNHTRCVTDCTEPSCGVCITRALTLFIEGERVTSIILVERPSDCLHVQGAMRIKLANSAELIFALGEGGISNTSNARTPAINVTFFEGSGSGGTNFVRNVLTDALMCGGTSGAVVFILYKLCDHYQLGARTCCRRRLPNDTEPLLHEIPSTPNGTTYVAGRPDTVDEELDGPAF